MALQKHSFTKLFATNLAWNGCASFTAFVKVDLLHVCVQVLCLGVGVATGRAGPLLLSPVLLFHVTLQVGKVSERVGTLRA